MAPTSDERVTTFWRRIIVCVLLTLVGFNLRSVILAVPPVLPQIQHDLGLSYSATGLLTALPVLMMGTMAWPSGMLAERIGARSCVTLGLLFLGLGSLLRALWATAISLFFFTFLLSLGIALAQTAVPVLVRRWLPAHIGLASALFTDGLFIGELLGAAITVPVMVQFFGKDAWTSTFVLWGIIVIALLVFWLWLAPPSSPTAARLPFSLKSAVTPVRPEGDKPRSKRTRIHPLHLGILVGSGSLIYFGMNGWVAPYNQAIHHANMTPLALAVLNGAQLPVSLALTLVAQQLAGRRWPFIMAGAVCSIAVVGWIFMPVEWELVWAALLGGFAGFVLTLGIALPPLLAKPEEVARLSGTTLALTYCIAFAGPFVGGELWDLFHLPPLAFLPVAVASITLIILGALLPPRSQFGFFAESEHAAVSQLDTAKPTPPTV